MINSLFSKSNIGLLFFIAIIATILSILSYQYSSFTASKIAGIASEDVRSNARIEAYHLSQILIHSINSITNNLEALTNSVPLLYSDNQTVKFLLNNAQDSTRELTSAYYLLDSNGKVNSWSNSSDSELQLQRDLDLSKMEYYLAPRNTKMPYYSTVNRSPSGDKIFISFPILSTSLDTARNTDTPNTTESFRGVIVSAIDVNRVGKFLQDRLSPELVSNVGLMDKNGIFLYARNESLIGKNFLSKDFQSTIPSNIKSSYNDILKRSLGPRAGAQDVSISDKTTTISYRPIIIDGKQLWTLYIGSPHTLTSDVGLLIEQQKNFSTMVVIIIGAIAIGIAFIILSWNKRLKTSVMNRTLELKRANDSLIESNRLLEAANEQLKVHDRMQKEFINVAAHELRTPIMPILGDAQYIERQFDNDDPRIQIEKDQVSSLIRNAKRLDRLASDILDVTRIESKSLKLNKEKFNLKEIVLSNLADIKRFEYEGSGFPDIKYTPKDIIVNADKGRLSQVIANLLSNAIKFTDKGVITIKTCESDGEVIVSIRDSGSGIDPEIFPKLFSKFITKSDRGTGLGLFISKSIIESHGGKIWAENNQIEPGATFYFSLPAVDNGLDRH
ncbi:MAG TPA: sensor histidine kinase [Nitrososphaeraceae archaeon]|nr:sensor histidine kinase [Nitrososphaeraceae archaeon]